MDPMRWFLIILLVLLIAAIIFLLTRRSAGGRGKAEQQAEDGPAQDPHAPGGAHVAAGDTGATGDSDAGYSAREPFDQEADPAMGSDPNAPEPTPEATYVDTASGVEVPVAEATGEESAPDAEVAPEAEAAPAAFDESAQQDRGLAENAADDQGEHETAQDNDLIEREVEQEEAARSVTYGEPAPAAEETTYAAPESFEASADPDPAFVASEEATLVPPAQTDWDEADDVPANATSAGFVESEPFDSQTFVTEPNTSEHAADEHSASESGDTEPGEPQPAAVEPGITDIVEGPYGPGSALSNEDGSDPVGFVVKGNQGSMLFHTDESPNFSSSRADVWFDSEERAKAAGFVHWDRKRR